MRNTLFNSDVAGDRITRWIPVQNTTNGDIGLTPNPEHPEFESMPKANGDFAFIWVPEKQDFYGADTENLNYVNWTFYIHHLAMHFVNSSIFSCMKLLSITQLHMSENSTREIWESVSKGYENDYLVSLDTFGIKHVLEKQEHNGRTLD